MTRFAVFVALLVLAPAGALAITQADPKDTSKNPGAFEGTWTIESVNGSKLSDIGQKGSLAFARDTYTVTMNGMITERGTFKLDTRTKPTNIDMKINEGVAMGRTQIGLVQIVGDTLTLKTNTVGTPPRPTDFKPQTWYVLIVAKKSK